jgi:hypothetical protein
MFKDILEEHTAFISGQKSKICMDEKWYGYRERDRQDRSPE